MKAPNSERLGRLADKCDNLVHSAQLFHLPDKIHKEQLAAAMAEIRDELRAIYTDETGDNPWN
jgi:hypothetical protein